ncbi:MAG: DinB family protein [Chloroflexi bacterium]|nr:DinB family protein [Chloroflexota bacterium]
MAEPLIDLRGFILAQVESGTRSVKLAMDGLTGEQLYYMPTADTNSIAWLAWHLSRYRDAITSAICDESQVWVTEGWAPRFGMEPDRDGIGDTPEQVAAFRPDPGTLSGYIDAVHTAGMKRIGRLTDEQLNRVGVYVFPNERPAWRALASMIGDSGQHNGQINYVRGMVSGFGWRNA